MYTIIVATLFAAAAMAAPARIALPTVNFSVSNDVSGANVGRSVLADSHANRFGDLFAGSNLVQNGRVIATSLQTTTAIAQGRCTVRNATGAQIGLLNAQKTFVDLDGQAGAVGADVSDFVITCEDQE